ncbi:uncharacterized protein LOC116302038 [Actinia tenebrosa]|uniref:Uncharacterized protein LOC116302038 n=1 Tax=Actinia tenebrosa TaxID=6105 RepID=A0A6P8IK53_ACTTE|nr:uncharacterized protein LOC116302038 [Actinia tenebrosa]
MSNERKFDHSKLDYFYSPREENESLNKKKHGLGKKIDGQQKTSSVIKMLDALRLSSYDTNHKTVNNNKALVPSFTRSETDLKDKLFVWGKISSIDKDRGARRQEGTVYRNNKIYRLSQEKFSQFDDSTDSHSDSAYSQSSDLSRESDVQSLNTSSSDSDTNLYVYQQIIHGDSSSSSPSRINTITVHTASGFTIDLDVEVTKTVVMLMKIIVWLRQRYPNGSFICQRLPIGLTNSPLNSIGESSGDESLSSQETLKPLKSRKRISFSPNTLLFAAVTEKSYEEAKSILESDCDINVNVQTPSGQTLIHIAAGNADLKCVQLLLEHLADPNIKDCRGWGPLHAAIRKGKWKCAILLIEAGANFAEYAANRIKEYKEVLSMSKTCYRSMEIFV